MMFSTVSRNPCPRASAGAPSRITTTATDHVRRMIISPLARAALICALAAACTSKPPLRVGTTTTVQQSGALDELDSLADAAPARFAVVIGPSGQILRSAAAGDLDVVLVHAPALEQRVLAGHWTRRCPFGASRFGIVGPRADPAHAAQAASAPAALRRIRASGAMFVSRGDSSGTHEKERTLWRAAGVEPEPSDTYFETGGDQATTLRLADEWGAYALADLPTLAHQRGLALAVLFARDSLLANPYTLYVVRADSGVAARADTLAQWLMARWRPRVLALRLADGTPAFEGGSANCEAP